MGTKGTAVLRGIPSPLRDWGEVAIAAGWTIELTGGHHLRWTNLDKIVGFSPTTPGDNYRGLYPFRAWLRRSGLDV
jgi:hypothetical protein